MTVTHGDLRAWAPRLLDPVTDKAIRRSLVEYLHIMDMYATRYGFYSIACLLAKYHLLAHAVDIAYFLMNSGDQRCSQLLGAGRRLAQDHYDKTRRAAPVAASSAQVSRVLTPLGEKITYLAEENDRRAAAGALLPGSVRRVDSVLAERIVPRQFYLYAVDDQLVPYVYDQPVGLTGLAMNRPGVVADIMAVTHPLLVQNRGLSVYGAGEIMFVKTVEGRTAGVIVNNKSGHFRPGSESLAITVSAVSEGLGLPPSLVVPIAVERTP